MFCFLYPPNIKYIEALSEKHVWQNNHWNGYPSQIDRLDQLFFINNVAFLEKCSIWINFLRTQQLVKKMCFIKTSQTKNFIIGIKCWNFLHVFWHQMPLASGYASKTLQSQRSHFVEFTLKLWAKEDCSFVSKVQIWQLFTIRIISPLPAAILRRRALFGKYGSRTPVIGFFSV